MATITTLVQSGALEKLDPELEPQELEHRLIYIHASLLSRLETDIVQWESIWQIEQSPVQQLDALVEIFCSGEALTIGRRFKTLNHLGAGVWELKTPDLRLFGWFPHKNCFLLVELDLTNKVKTHNLYAGYAGSVVRKRDGLDLDEPKYVTGTDPSNVVSNYNFP